MLKKFLGTIVALILAGGAGTFFLPAQYSASRNVLIHAPVETVFHLVNNLRENEKWSPWRLEDPSTVVTYGDIPEGVGAKYSWTSKKMGEGTLTITKSEMPHRIECDLNFHEQGNALAWFTFEPKDGGVLTTWGMNGEAGTNPVKRIFGALMDRMVGPQFEKGLQLLKQAAESAPAHAPGAMTPPAPPHHN